MSDGKNEEKKKEQELSEEQLDEAAGGKAKELAPYGTPRPNPPPPAPSGPSWVLL